MKLLKSVVSVLTASMMCFTFSGAVYAQELEQQPDAFEKISERLLEKYGVNSSNYSSQSVEQVVESSSKELPVMIWCTQDIDYNAVEQKALPVLTETMQTASTFSVSSISSVEDVLANAESLSDEAIQEFIASERAESRKMYQEFNGQFVEKYMSDEDILYISEYSPVVFANLTLDKVVDLAESSDTLEFSYAGIDEEIEDPLDVSVPSIKADKVHTNYGYTGKGVKIGQLETYVPDVNDSQLSPIKSRIHLKNTTYTGNHATFVADIMVGQKVGTFSCGVAPDAELYSASHHQFYGSETNLAGKISAVEWLLSQDVNVINASTVFGNPLENNFANAYQAPEKWLDHIANKHNVTFVMSSGNNGKNGVITGAMAYNIITVGNMDCKSSKDITKAKIRDSSSYSLSTEYAYKPDLCAPGVSIVTSASPTGASGTSASAPHVTGAVALLMQAKPVLKLQPATIKSILTSSVNTETDKRFCPTDWAPDSNYEKYNKYGAGLLDIEKAIDTAKMAHYYNSELTPAKNEEKFTMNVTESEKLVRVSLAFLMNSTSTIYNDENINAIRTSSLPNLNLVIYAPDGTLIRSSSSANNSVEIAEFTAPTAGTYTIRVYKYGSALTENVKYGLSWIEE
ncbi:MAG: S8 family serine peptidase [Oscillospiraceae bacterium]|nr:S8 family serine peptidase [Oscillospiraceae bacterium]